MKPNLVPKIHPIDFFISEEDLLAFASKVVTRYVYQGTIPEREKEDVVMSVVQRFWEKKEKIIASFSGEAKRSTYCIAVLNRMCCEVIRKELMHWKSRPEEYIGDRGSCGLSSAEALVINDEISLLDIIFRLDAGQMPKKLIFFAYYFHLKPNKKHLANYGVNGYLQKTLTLLNPVNVNSKGQLFENLALVVNDCEGKSVKPDAVRMWLNKAMDKIIDRLNGPFGRANYDREAFRTLFEHYYLSDGS